MTPDLFSSPLVTSEAAAAPAPPSGRAGELAGEPAGKPAPVAVGDWVLAPQRYYPDGRPRPRFCWPAKMDPAPTKRNMKRALEKYRARKAKDLRRQTARHKTARQTDAAEAQEETTEKESEE